jgi:hypothetical protein
VGPVLRLFRFRPAVSGFDVAIRDVLITDVRRLHGNLAAYAGRVGPDEAGERLIATVWESREAMVAGVGENLDRPVFHPELLEGSEDRRLDILPIAFSLEPDRALEAGIIRLVTGLTRPGDQQAYVAAVEAGAATDRAAGTGPVALYLGVLAPDSFTTLSLWAAWGDLEAATGADIRATGRTRHEELLERWSASHYEAVPGIT